MQDHQTTLGTTVTLSGVGVHGGKPVSLHIHPAEPGTGIVFHLADGEGATHELRALWTEVGSTDLCTLLGSPGGAHVATVEHLLAALIGMGIDNVAIEVDGNEAPILDGSAADYVDAFDRAGIVSAAVKRRYIRVLKPVRYEQGASWAEFRPHAGTRYEVEIDFASPAIGRQRFEAELTADFFRREIARARTFGFMKDVERLWAAGFALGSSLENSVVIGDDHRVINVGGLRYENEFVRHKMLDAIGDLALAGGRFMGCFRSYRGGHKVNAATLAQLLADPEAYEIVEAGGKSKGRAGDMVAVRLSGLSPWG